MIRTLQGHSNPVWSVALSPDGTRALSGSDDKTLILWNLTKGDYSASFCSDHSFYACAPSTDGTTIVASDAAGTVHFFSVIESESQ